MSINQLANQKGEVQPIGGINQKIEGFFEVCRAKGFTGDQGVMMPMKNLQHLMLRQEAVDAVKQGQFHIWAVGTIDEGVEGICQDIEAKFPYILNRKDGQICPSFCSNDDILVGLPSRSPGGGLGIRLRLLIRA